MGDEFVVFAPKSTSKKYNVMRFSSGDKADIKKWTQATLSRDLSAKKQYEDDFDFPEFGEGSEFGKRRREEARRLKYGKKKSKFVVENQPWDLSISTLEVPMDDKKANIDVKPKIVNKDFHGKKEGGIGEGSMYFVFTQRPNHSFEAYPVQDWCNFSRKISHRTLTDEEAEAAWDKRDKILNHLNYMARKRLHIEDSADNEEQGTSEGKAIAGSSKSVKPVELQIHDHEEDVGFISNSDDEENEKGKSTQKKVTKKQAKAKQEELSDSEVEGKEDSDDGENEGAEIAYDTDVSSENEEVEDSRIAPKGLDELSESSSSEDEEEVKEDQAQKDQSSVKIKDEPVSSAESDLDDIDGNENYNKSALLQAKKAGKKDLDKDRSRSNTPTVDKKGSAIKSAAAKIKMEASTGGRQASPLATGRKESQAQKRSAENIPSKNDAKRQKISNNSAAATSSKDVGQASSSTSAITAEAVRRILMHKPITIPKLLKKFRSKSDLNKEEICNHITGILRTMKLHKIKINDKMHLYLKG